jgi:hypothetical protein
VLAKASPSVLTVMAVLGLGGMVYFIMRFCTRSDVGLPLVYWLVPVFGAVGEAVGGLLDDKTGHDKRLALCRMDHPDGIRLGVVGDVCIGLGGATAAVFLLGNVFLRGTATSTADIALMISVSFLAGVFGKDIVHLAGEKLLRQAEQRAEQKATEVVAKPAAVAWAVAARGLNAGGHPEEALRCVEKALQYDSENITAYVEKGRALKLMGNNHLPEALAAVEAGLRIAADDSTLLYNRTCYWSLLKMNPEQILADLGKVLRSQPQFRKTAEDDPDLDWAREKIPGVKELIASSGQPKTDG